MNHLTCSLCFLASYAFIFGSSVAWADPASPTAKKPNLLVILADDLGYGELGCQGNAQIPTPHIDSLAAGGIRFTSGYVSGPVCGPTRAGLLTGRYQQRFGFEYNLGGSGGGLPAQEVTLADRLHAAGYATGMFGKWHLGDKKQHAPTNRGFDWFYGFLPACRPYPIRPGELGKSLLPEAESAKLTYMTDAQGAEAAAFIEQNKNRPWFVYLPFGAVHCPPGVLVPKASTPKYTDRFTAIENEKRRIFAGMESAMDDAVGVVLAKVRKLNLEENTLIIFLSDNGGPTWQTTSGNGPIRGAKGDVLEGGIRVPFIVQWKGQLPAGKVDDRPIIQLDIMPTVLAAAGVELAPSDNLDGVNLLPYLRGEKTDPPREALCWRYGEKNAVRMGHWKLTNQGDGAKLYNVAKDLGEKEDLATAEPAKVKELTAAYEKWNAQNVAPKWVTKSKPPKATADKADEE